MSKSRSSEVHAYGWIKKALKRLGFNTGNPNRNPAGEVYTQHESHEHPLLKKALGGSVPENIVSITAAEFWVIEAKADPDELAKAHKEAVKDYADKINAASEGRIGVRFASGVAGSDEDGYKAKTSFLDSKGNWREVTLSGKPLRHRLLKKEFHHIMSRDIPDIARGELTAREIVELSQKINRILHKAKVEKEKRAPTIAVLLLALDAFPDLRLSSDADVFIQDINARAEKIFRDSEKSNLWEQIKPIAPKKKPIAYVNNLSQQLEEDLSTR